MLSAILLPLLPALASAAPARPALQPRSPWKENNWGSFFGAWGDGAKVASYSSGSEPAFTGVTHLVIVGGDAGLVYDPPTTIAAPGDVVAFEFRFKNHTVTQSAFDTPCQPLDKGFKSGFQPVDMAATNFPGFVVTVTDNKPLWFYCGQQAPQPHCQAGMVGAINAPPEGNTFEAFKAKAVALAAGGSDSGAGKDDGKGGGMDSGNGSGGSGGGGGGDPKKHYVKVGGAAGLVYDPPVTWAAPGDEVIFSFDFKNHTVTQSAFDAPCSPLMDGFKSGFIPVDDAKSKSGDLPEFSVTVKDDKPLWFYCGQQAPQPHCPQGMVGAINPPKEGNTFDAFKTRALAIAKGAEIASTIKTRCPTAGVDQLIPTDQKNISTAPADNPVKFVTHGFGTQNYTCTDGKFAKNQAVAKLVDTSCLVGQPVFNWISPIGQQLDLNDPFGSAEKVKSAMKDVDPKYVDIVATLVSNPTFDLGRHMFIPFPEPTSTTANPKFDLSLGTKDPNQFIVANLTGSIDSPDGAKDNIKWLQLLSLQGGLTTNMYRLQTAGGQPPTSCSKEGEQTFIPYGARYDF